MTSEGDKQEQKIRQRTMHKSVTSSTDATSVANGNRSQRLMRLLPPRWQNPALRLIAAIFMIGSFSLIVYWGPLAIVGLILIIQFLCFREIINIGHSVYENQDLSGFRQLSWYFLFAANFYFFGESMLDQFRILLQRDQLLQPLLNYHRFIAFLLYCCGFIVFVLSLVKRHYTQQFTLFAWTHMALFVFVISSNLMIRNVFSGVIWLVLPAAMIIVNDIMAYVFGFAFGRTPLIQLSPKKTWEGFLGGGVFTILISLMLGHALIQFDCLVCPIEYDEASDSVSAECQRGWEFVEMEVTVAGFPIPWYPFNWHCAVLASFASIVAPFGGFFASGFKRAFKIKDFGDLIPGHGGVTDRFDCHVIMGAFVYVYLQSFVGAVTPQQLLRQVYSLKPEDQLNFYGTLADHLVDRGLLNSTRL